MAATERPSFLSQVLSTLKVDSDLAQSVTHASEESGRRSGGYSLPGGGGNHGPVHDGPGRTNEAGEGGGSPNEHQNNRKKLRKQLFYTFGVCKDCCGYIRNNRMGKFPVWCTTLPVVRCFVSLLLFPLPLCLPPCLPTYLPTYLPPSLPPSLPLSLPPSFSISLSPPTLFLSLPPYPFQES